MNEFLADLHIHSRFSRATSSKLSIPLLAAWARLKGLTVLGTGDFTHPKWRDELRAHLRFDEASGLYVPIRHESDPGLLPEFPIHPGESGKGRKREQRDREDDTGLALPGVHFMLQGEISSIYKRGGQVRRVHNLVFMPTLEAAEAFSLRLAQLGNLHSDGRPILGLDSRDLLELVLETHPQAFLVPAHIWTPWFSLFGSKSGFDRLEDCFGDLSGEVFALETGLSSDPAMNRLWSALDNYRLISNSDAHSGENLGREANLFAGPISYAGMFEALKHPDRSGATRFLGTLEFFPEEGKYHMDGHRKCNVRLSPEETRALGGICPVCGHPLTVGVFNRVMELADREEPLYQATAPPEEGTPEQERAEDLGPGGFASLVPLPEILSEILGVGPKSRKVTDWYAKTLDRFGPELAILRQTPEADLARFLPPLGEAVGRMRRGEVHRHGGFDGEYGSVRMFSDQERQELLRGATPAKSGQGGRGGVQGLTLPGAEPAPRKTVRTRRGGSTGKNKGSADSDEAGPAPGSEESRMRFGTDNAPPALASAPAEGKNPTKDPDISVQHKVEQHEAGKTKGKELLSGNSSVSVRTPSGKNAEGEVGSWPDPGSSQEPEQAEPARAGLNREQEQAVLAGPGPVLVLAGPGTGKTRTLIARVLHLLQQGVPARRILAVTFTRRAAGELDSRLAAALGRAAPLPRTDTLHALALELWHKTNTDMPVLLSEESARRVFAEANSEETAHSVREAWQAVNLARERLEPPPPSYEEQARRYLAQKNNWNLVDYTDLLEFWLEQISSGLYSCPWGHVLVDEIQDLSALQLTLIRGLSSATGQGFFGIGDPDQSIYGFRGAHGQSQSFFREAWPRLEIIGLTRNYRSCAGIPEASHALLGNHAVSPALVPARSAPAQLHLFAAPTAEAEAAWIAERAAERIGLGSHTLADNAPDQEPDHSPGDMAVLVRTRALAALYRKMLSRKGVPVSDPVADAFWIDERVALLLRAAGRMLGIADLPEDAHSAAPLVCPDKFFAKGPVGLAACLSTFPPFDSLFWQSSAFRSLIKAYDENKGWTGLLNWISLQNELELVRAKGETVQIMSLHAAKGLEFRTVFLPALEDGLLPFAGPELLAGKMIDTNRNASLEEERRLFYVGLTRARDALFLSHAAKRLLYGRELRLRPSRFLQDLPSGLFSRSALVARSTRREEQLPLL